MPSVQITIEPDVTQINCARFSAFVAASFDARSQLSFFALNSSNSCFAFLSISPSCLSVSDARLDPEDELFKQAFRIPMKPFAHFLSRISSLKVDVSFELSKFGISFFSNPDEGSTITYKTQFESLPQMTIPLPPTDRFPNQILGCDLEWFFALLHSVNRSTIKTTSMVALQCVPGVGLRIALTGNEEAQITLGSSQFANYVANEFSPILVSLKEFYTFLNFCKRCERPVDLYFSSAGLPLLATFSSVDGVNCRFIFSTIVAQSLNADIGDEGEHEIPATDDEDESF